MYNRKSILVSVFVFICIASRISSLPLQKQSNLIESKINKNEKLNLLDSKKKRDDSNNSEQDTQLEDEEEQAPKSYPTIQELLSNQKPLGKFNQFQAIFLN
jgi:hypothetical protein